MQEILSLRISILVSNMSSEEKIARGVAPVKEEFIRRVARVRVDTVTGSLGVASSSEKNQQGAKKKSRNQLRKARVSCLLHLLSY